MKELITLSLGPLSNFTSAHFWNFQDEWFKQDQPTSLDRNVVLYYETQKTRQFVPRSVFIDFESNFGSYLSSFNHPRPSKEQSQWHGPVKVSESEALPQSEF